MKFKDLYLTFLNNNMAKYYLFPVMLEYFTADIYLPCKECPTDVQQMSNKDVFKATRDQYLFIKEVFTEKWWV